MKLLQWGNGKIWLWWNLELYICVPSVCVCVCVCMICAWIKTNSVIVLDCTYSYSLPYTKVVSILIVLYVLHCYDSNSHILSSYRSPKCMMIYWRKKKIWVSNWSKQKRRGKDLWRIMIFWTGKWMIMPRFVWQAVSPPPRPPLAPPLPPPIERRVAIISIIVSCPALHHSSLG